jgi:hypothetical protein
MSKGRGTRRAGFDEGKRRETGRTPRHAVGSFNDDSHNWTSCEMYGHNFREPDGTPTETCVDCGEGELHDWARNDCRDCGVVLASVVERNAGICTTCVFARL